MGSKTCHKIVLTTKFEKDNEMDCQSPATYPICSKDVTVSIQKTMLLKRPIRAPLIQSFAMFRYLGRFFNNRQFRNRPTVYKNYQN